MTHKFCISTCLPLVTAAIPLRAATGPHAETNSQSVKVWTNDDLDKLRHAGLISVAGKADDENPMPESTPQTSETTQNPEWYAQQAARLRDEFERRKAELPQDALDDARSLKDTTGGIDPVCEDFASLHVYYALLKGFRLVPGGISDERWG
jgi:hypothetical protein